MNYYIGGTNTHIGKRSAAGFYCWECNMTLHKGGFHGVHLGCVAQGHSPMCDCNWYKKCPKCGRRPSKEDFPNNSVGRELGFNTLPFKRKKGVRSCASFTWAIVKERLPIKRKIVDEVGRKYSKEEFLQILEECPIQFYHLIGEEFS